MPFARLTPALRLKMQHVFFPGEVLPIFSCGHLEHFLAQLGVTWKRDREKDRYTATANRLLLSELRKLPTLADWTPTELERLLYTWSAPTREPAREPIAEFAKRFNRSALADAAREAWLYARRLLRQLALGGPHEYMERSDDLPLVRGRIHFARQATLLFCRPDIVACDWAEFSPDTPLARLLRCAAEVLLARTRLPGAAADLRDAISILEETESVRAKEALSGAAAVRWSRMNERWRACYELAVAALSGLGRELHAGDTESFVFLLDMNFLFESYCGRWLERKFAVAVSEQKRLGHLLKTPQSCGQKPDFQWRHGGSVWVGDAKYKQRSGDDWPQIADIRQLICYGRLAEQIHAIPSRLTLLYPTLNAEVQEVWTTFENQPLELRAVRVVK